MSAGAARTPPALRLYPYARSADQDADTPARHPVIVIGGGPVGLATALDLGRKGVPVLLLDENEGVGEGSRAICMAKRSLEIADRLGCAAPMIARGIVWNLGKVFHEDRKVYEFNLLPEDGHAFPAFINLQQPYLETYLVEAIRRAQAEGAPIEIRGGNRLTALAPDDTGATLTVATPDGDHTLRADWLIACDGASSPTRTMLGLDFEGRVFRDSFLIADVTMKADFPTERWFWFEPAHRAGASTLLHRQPDGVWRVDFQIGWDVDRDHELKPENVRRRLTAMLGPEIDYDIVWTSIYTFQCRRMRRFRHGRTIFAGDSAHQVSPFGARGANSGLQDADNLAWKLAMVLRGEAPEALLDSYDHERRQAADENIAASTRSTDFITPKSKVSHTFRNAVLALAGRHAFARPLVNSGRLSTPCTHDGSPLNTPDALPGGPARTRPGSPCPDATLEDGFLLPRLGDRFTLLALNIDPDSDLPCVALFAPPGSDLAARYLGAARQALYLVRPDQHVAARWPSHDPDAVAAALKRATGTPC